MAELWYLFLTGASSGIFNMDFDRHLLYEQPSRPILRFYRWRVPTISLGYLQNPEELELENCSRDGVDVVIRPTGGRAIYHWDEVTYSVFVPPNHALAQLSVMESYKIISKCLVTGLRKLSIDAELAPTTKGSLKNPSCFSSHSRYEVVWKGKKLIGSAQRRINKGGFLQQGSILLSKSYLLLISYLLKKTSLHGSITLQEILGYVPNDSIIISALTDGFRDTLKVEFKRF